MSRDGVEVAAQAVGCCLEIVERGVAAAREFLAATLAAKMLNVLPDPAFAVADQGVALIIGDAEVGAMRIEAGETCGGELFLASSCALAPGVRLHRSLNRSRLQAQALAAVWAVLG